MDLIPAVIRALPERLRSRAEFVLSLTEAEYRARIGGQIPSQLHLTGPVPPPECPGLYQECDAMFLPTLAECFSASYPEAMRMDRPIVTTDLGFARSICGDAALYFTPCDAQSAADAIARLVDDPSLQQDLRDRGRRCLPVFDTPGSRAAKVLECCEQLVRAGSIAKSW